MQDILERELKDGDICVGVGNEDIQMLIGVWYNDSIIDENGHNRHIQNVFKVVNPTNDEFELADKINNKLQQIENKEIGNELQTIPFKDLIVGGIYKSINCYYIYLGKRKVTVEVKYYNLQRKRFVNDGYCFSMIQDIQNEELIKKDITYPTWYGESSIKVLKENEKSTGLIKLIKTINLNFPISAKYRNYSMNYEIVIE